MPVEYEWKFRADPDAQEAIYRGTKGAWQEISMETTYYDTSDGALSKLHYTLRRRMENGKSVCTIKTPADHGGRGEWEVEERCIEAAIPELCKLGAPDDLLSLTEKGVMPVCGARFIRRACAVDMGAAVVELALDRGVLMGGNREIPLCEIEAELKCGTFEAAAAFANLLAKRYDLQPEEKSKFRRALDLTKKES